MGSRSGLYRGDNEPVPLEGVHVEAKIVDVVRNLTYSSLTSIFVLSETLILT